MAHPGEAVRTHEPPSPLTMEQRQRILNDEVVKYQRQGWVVLNRSDTNAQLEKTLRPFPIWLFLVFFRRTRTMFLEVDESGLVHRSIHS